jgi:hypothetical protein
MLFAAPAAAQIPQPVVLPSPGSDFLSHYDFWLTAAALAIDNEQFSWDTHFGGAVDVADYIVGRTAVRIDYQAILGNELRAFDPNQGNYTLEASSSARIGDRTEIAGIFHHVSRHLSDRTKRPAIAWNEAGVRILRRQTIGTITIDADLEGGAVVQHSTVDYRWIGELNLLVRRPLTPRVGVFLQGSGQIVGVDETADPAHPRGNQVGGLGEVGFRINGRGGILELFAGFEQRVDANPLVAGSQHWGLAGFRLLSR